MKRIMIALAEVPVEKPETPKVVNRLPSARSRSVNALLTARDDVLHIRRALLAGDDKTALRRTDWLLDCIEEHIAEG